MDDIKLTINGVEYTWEEAEELYQKLDKLFGNKEPTVVYPYQPTFPWSTTVELNEHSCLIDNAGTITMV